VVIRSEETDVQEVLRDPALPAPLPFEHRIDEPTVCVLIPTLNEAKNLPHILTRIPAHYEVVIVDGRSTDGTVDVARELRPSARVIEQNGHGKGDAITSGFAAASSDIIVMLDGDGSARVEEIPRYLAALHAGADFAKGSRFLGDGGSADITLLRRLGNWGLTQLVNVLFRARYTDLCYGYNAFWADRIDDLSLDAKGFEVETQLNIRACKARLAITEVPSFEDLRIHGASNLNAVRDGLRVLRTIFRERFGCDARAGVVPDVRVPLPAEASE